MKIRVTKQYGTAKIEVELEATDIKEALLKAAIFTTKDVCDLCKCTEVGLDGSQTGDGIIYIKRKCSKCAAASTMGSYKNGKGFFWKKFEHWKKDGQDSAPPPEQRIEDEDF